MSGGGEVGAEGPREGERDERRPVALRETERGWIRLIIFGPTGELHFEAMDR